MKIQQKLKIENSTKIEKWTKVENWKTEKLEIGGEKIKNRQNWNQKSRLLFENWTGLKIGQKWIFGQ